VTAALGADPPPRPRVVVVGDAMLDVLVEVRGPFAYASDTTSCISTSPGGSGANQAVWLARAGLDAALVGAVGEDPLGDAAVATLAAQGVDVTRVARSDRPTGTVVALVEPDGQRSMLTDRGANLALDPRWVEDALAADPLDHVHVSGYCLLDEATRPAGVVALATARRRGATRSIDVASAGPLRAIGAARFLDLVRGCDLLFCNLEEGGALTGCSGTAAVLEALARDFAEVVCTLGAEGAVAVAREGAMHRTHPVRLDVADTVGAGDAFAATYLATRLRGVAVEGALKQANAAASGAVGSRGARAWERTYSRE
jgi:ribokinase